MGWKCIKCAEKDEKCLIGHILDLDLKISVTKTFRWEFISTLTLHQHEGDSVSVYTITRKGKKKDDINGEQGISCSAGNLRPKWYINRPDRHVCRIEDLKIDVNL